ncbi:MAG: hypothetical protein WC605_09285, partial [Bacteroidales bacterium]
MKKNPEVRLLIKILAIIGFVILILLLAGYVFIRVRTPQLLEFSKGTAELRITVKLDSLDGARFITGMNGCENLFLEDSSEGVYVSCLDGNIHHLDTDLSGKLVVQKSF